MNKNNMYERLQNALEKDFISVNKNNPILKNIENLNHEQKLEVLCQYSIFPKNIISMLVSATYALSYFSWNEVVKELSQNIQEEMGLDQGKIADFKLPHYTILRKLFMDCFELDINLTQSNMSTSVFIENVKEVFESNNPEFISGGVYALESSAIPELSIVKKMVLSVLESMQKEPPKLLLDFFDWHINEIEINHRDRLLSMVDKHIKDEKGWLAFERGFRKVMTIMDTWWTALNEESTCSKNLNIQIFID